MTERFAKSLLYTSALMWLVIVLFSGSQRLSHSFPLVLELGRKLGVHPYGDRFSPFACFYCCIEEGQSLFHSTSDECMEWIVAARAEVFAMSGTLPVQHFDANMSDIVRRRYLFESASDPTMSLTVSILVTGPLDQGTSILCAYLLGESLKLQGHRVLIDSTSQFLATWPDSVRTDACVLIRGESSGRGSPSSLARMRIGEKCHDHGGLLIWWPLYMDFERITLRL
jgi:hypothetical protein